MGLITYNPTLLALRRGLKQMLPAVGSAPHPNTYSLREIRPDLSARPETESAELVHGARGKLPSLQRQYWVFVAPTAVGGA